MYPPSPLGLSVFGAAIMHPLPMFNMCQALRRIMVNSCRSYTSISWMGGGGYWKNSANRGDSEAVSASPFIATLECPALCRFTVTTAMVGPHAKQAVWSKEYKEHLTRAPSQPKSKPSSFSCFSVPVQFEARGRDPEQSR